MDHKQQTAQPQKAMQTQDAAPLQKPACPQKPESEQQLDRHLSQSQDHIHQELIPRAASFFKVVGDETRMKILCSIAREELCVNDIAGRVSMTKSAVSHQLKLLKDEDLVKARRDGKNIFYSLDDQHVLDIIEIAFTHIDHKCHGTGCGCAACRGEE